MGGYGGKNGPSGGLNSAEIFNPTTRRTCSVGNLKLARTEHTMCNNMVCGGCGGRKARKSCEKFDGISSFTSLPVSLVKGRYGHLCWGLRSGDVLLLGGQEASTTERVSADGSSSKLDFKLPYKIR